MVFLTSQLFVRSRGPDEFWRKRQIFKLAAHYFGRRRNCYSIAIKNVHKSLLNATRGRKLKKEDMKELWETRINAATNEHGITLKTLFEGLSRCNIFLNRKSLANLAVWEPRTFKCLSDVACAKAKLGGIKEVADNPMHFSVVFILLLMIIYLQEMYTPLGRAKQNTILSIANCRITFHCSNMISIFFYAENRKKYIS